MNIEVPNYKWDSVERWLDSKCIEYTQFSCGDNIILEADSDTINEVESILLTI